MRTNPPLLVAAALAILAPAAALAQDPPAKVEFTLDAAQLSLRDKTRNDSFKVILDDAQVTTALELECSAGASGFLGLGRVDEECAVRGTGVIKNPENPSQTIPRVNYTGGFKVQAKQDGYTPANTIVANYQAVGQIGASTAPFGGSLTLLPENPSQGVLDLVKRVSDEAVRTAAGAGQGVTIVDEFDAISLNGFTTPSAGFPSDPGCVWNGNMIFNYATYAWIMDLSAVCGGETYVLKGNMPWLDIEGESHNAVYALNITRPAAGATGDAGLFSSGGSGDSGLFAAVDGIAGEIRMTQTDFVEVEIGDGVTDNVATNIKAEAILTGTGVPLELVRSFAQVIAIQARSFFGA